MRARASRFALAVLLGGLGLALGAGITGHPESALAAAPSGGEWTTYGGAPSRASVQPHSPRMRPLRRRWLTGGLAGDIYGQPLIAGGRVYVATEHDVVYALSASNGRVLWHRSVGSPVPAGDLPCGNIAPVVGITSTMVLDPASGRLFASAARLEHGAVRHVLVALDAASGRRLFVRDLDQPGWSAPAQLQRTGLALDEGRVLVGFGGNYGDCGAYHGYLMAVPVSGAGATLVYRVPTAREGAIWAPSGVAVTASGRVLLATGNGASNSTFDHGDSVIELDATMHEVGYFAPSNWAADNENDGDLGSTSPVLLHGGRAFIVGKEVTGYLLRVGHLGGIGGELASASICFAQGGHAYHGSVIYVGCPRSGVTAVRVGSRSLAVLWQASAADSGSPTFAAGVVWLVNGGRLVGLDPASGHELTVLPTIATEHFAAPAAGEGLLVVGGASGAVEAFAGPGGYRP